MTAADAVPEQTPASVQPTALQEFVASVSAVLAKESRWRMRGRRAFAIVTVYVGFVALFVLLVAKLLYDQANTFRAFDGPIRMPAGLASGTVSASIGQVIFGVIVSTQTALTMILAPALTSGAISMEREKQTLELLITTPVSTLGMVVGKLFASLAYVFLLILASIPLMSIVFAFGGIAPEDVVRSYLLMFAVAIGIGSIGLFMSALFKRTQISTAISYLIVLALAVGSLVLHSYLVASSQRFDENSFTPGHAPEAILLLNPIVADIDIGCTAIPESGFTCSYISSITSGGEPDFSNPPHDAFWPRSAIAFVVLGLLLTLATTQLIAPSRRIHRRRRLVPTAHQTAEP